MAKGVLPEHWLDELRWRVNIIDVVGEHVSLKRTGNRYIGLCPFHSEKTPSFNLDSESQLFYCFGCQKGGNVINFVMEYDKLDFVEAVTQLAERVHMQLPEGGGLPRPAYDTALREAVLEANAKAARYYYDLLWGDHGAAALDYLYRRGLDDQTIKKFGLGATGALWDGLTDYLTGSGVDFETQKAAGLALEKDTRRYDMFRERVVFPIISAQGKVLGFGGRVLGSGTPKYLNSPDTPVFNKKDGLYALNLVKKQRGLNRLLLVEGYMDVVALTQQGINGAVATLGTALTDNQARLARRYADSVWVCYDGDAAGQKATARALDILEDQRCPARAYDLPEGLDPDEYLRVHGREAFSRLKPLSPVEYRMRRAADGVDMTVEDNRLQYAIRCCQLLTKVETPIELDAHMTRLAADTGIDRDVLIRQLEAERGVRPRRERPRPANERGRGANRAAPVTQSQRAQYMLLAMLSKKMCAPGLVAQEDFIDPMARFMAGQLIAGVSPMALMDLMKTDEERALAARILGQELMIEPDNADKSVDDLIRQIRLEKLALAMEQAKAALALAKGDERRTLIDRIQQLSMEMDRP